VPYREQARILFRNGIQMKLNSDPLNIFSEDYFPRFVDKCHSFSKVLMEIPTLK
jgi:hypothetical protein